MAHNTKYSMDEGYVNIHGQDIRVFVCEKTGELLVPIDAIKEMGFRIYRKSQYNKLLVDDSQFKEEFDLFILQAAQNYMLQNKITFTESDIIESINKCKQVLIGTGEPQTPKNSFIKSHKIEKSPHDSITITTNVSPSPTNQNLQNQVKGFTHNKSPVAPQNLQNQVKGFTHNKSPAASVRSNGSKDVLQRQKSFHRNPSNREKSPIENNEPKMNFDLRKPRNLSMSSVEANGLQEPQQRNGSDAQPEKLKSIELTKPECCVLVTFIEKPNCVWVQDTENADDLLKMDGQIKKESNKPSKSGRYTLNKVYLAQYDDMWCRCKVIKFKPLTVFFIDYGNTAEVKEVKEASEELSKIPCLAARITISESSGVKVEQFESFKIRIRKQFDNGTYLVDVIKSENIQSPIEGPKIATFFTKPRPLYQLEANQKVMVVSETDGKLVLRNRECYQKLKEIEKALGQIKVSSVESVEKEQLVLCNRNNLQRAVVLNVQGNSIQVELLDYYETLTVDLSSLKHIDEFLAKTPVTYIVSPQIKGYNKESVKIIQDFIDKADKWTVVFNNGEFDLQKNEVLLSDMLKPAVKDSNRPMLKDSIMFEPKLGLGEYILNTFRNIDNLNIATDDAMNQYLNTLLIEKFEDETPYEPIVGEICYGLFQGNWSRCVIVRVMNLKYEVQFVDFGNLDLLTAEQLRKLPDKTRNVPIVGIPCKLTGFPDVDNVEDVFKNHLNESECYQINIKQKNGMTYEIEVPSVYDKVRAAF